MKQLAIYQRMKQLVLTQDYTVEQIMNATIKQIAVVLNLSKGEKLRLCRYWKSIKRHCIEIAQSNQDKKRLDEFRARFLVDNQVWLEENYPSVEFSHGTEKDKKYWTIWPEGKVENV